MAKQPFALAELNAHDFAIRIWYDAVDIVGLDLATGEYKVNVCATDTDTDTETSASTTADGCASGNTSERAGDCNTKFTEQWRTDLPYADNAVRPVFVQLLAATLRRQLAMMPETLETDTALLQGFEFVRQSARW